MLAKLAKYSDMRILERLQSPMPSLPPMREIELLHKTVCQAVNDPKRIQILYALSESPRNVTELSQALEMPQPTVSRHLGILRQRSIVSTQRDGAAVIYSLANGKVVQILDLMRVLMRDVVEQQSDILE